MPNRSMQVKYQKASVARAAYATDAQFRSDYHDSLRAEKLTSEIVAQLVADHTAKLRAQRAHQIAVRQSLGMRTSYAWSR